MTRHYSNPRPRKPVRRIADAPSLKADIAHSLHQHIERAVKSATTVMTAFAAQLTDAVANQHGALHALKHADSVFYAAATHDFYAQALRDVQRPSNEKGFDLLDNTVAMCKDALLHAARYPSPSTSTCTNLAQREHNRALAVFAADVGEYMKFLAAAPATAEEASAEQWTKQREFDRLYADDLAAYEADMREWKAHETRTA